MIHRARRALAFVALACFVGVAAASCAAGNNKLFGGGDEGSGGADATTTTATTTGSGGANGTGGAGGESATDAGVADAAVEAGAACATAVDCVALSDQCNEGACANGACVRQPANEFGGCDDGLFCTDNEACSSGVCLGGTPKVCPGGDACHLGTCDEAKKTCTISPGNDGNACSDGDPCTAVAACQGGTCVQQAQKDCSFLNQVCATGTCDSKQGCVAVPNPDGTACDDGVYCTVNDVCKAGQCGGVPNTCAAPGDVCMIGTCDEGLKTCVAVPGNDGAKCSSGDPCKGGETCGGGKCGGGAPANEGKACAPADKCQVGTTCGAGVCGKAVSVISQCIDGDGCCPPGCPADKDCLYWKGGVQQNVPAADLVGWSPCWSGTYDQSGPAVSQVLQQCPKAKLLLACRKVGDASFQLAAMAPRADVLFDCGQQQACSKSSNGVAWYYSDQASWGFAPDGAVVKRNSCDYDPGNEQQAGLRMCMHTSGGQMQTGFRCGDNSGEPTFWLNGNSSWERVVFQAD